MDKLIDYIEIKNFYSSKDLSRRVIGQATEGGNYFQHIKLTRTYTQNTLRTPTNKLEKDQALYKRR